MRGYKSVELRQYDYFIDQFADVTPVAVELKQSAEQLPDFEHPENALYVFGPEDGSLPRAFAQHCHRFLVIPTQHCTNLAGAVYTILYDRYYYYKRRMAGVEPWKPMSEILDEQRSWTEPKEAVVV